MRNTTQQWSNSSIQPHLLKSFPQNCSISESVPFIFHASFVTSDFDTRAANWIQQSLDSVSVGFNQGFRGLIADAIPVCSPAKRLNVVSAAGNEYQWRALKIFMPPQHLTSHCPFFSTHPTTTTNILAHLPEYRYIFTTFAHICIYIYIHMHYINSYMHTHINIFFQIFIHFNFLENSSE